MEFWREYRLGHQIGHYKKASPSDTELRELGAQPSSRLDELFAMIRVMIRVEAIEAESTKQKLSAVPPLSTKERFAGGRGPPPEIRLLPTPSAAGR